MVGLAVGEATWLIGGTTGDGVGPGGVTTAGDGEATSATGLGDGGFFG